MPIISYADDLVVIAPSAEVPQAEQELRRLARSAGFDLKYSPEEAVVDVRERELDWLGYRLRWRNNRMEVRWSLLNPQSEVERHASERRLEERFLKLYDLPNSWTRAAATFESLLRQAGPCYEFTNRKTAYELILSAAASAGFDDLPSFASAEQAWKRAHGQWLETRKLVRRSCPAQQSRRVEEASAREPSGAHAEAVEELNARSAPWE